VSNWDYPSNSTLADSDGDVTTPWQYWFSRINSVAQTLQQSGPTADRPTAQVWVGRQYYDTTLNKPVYVSSVRPIVWRDAAGTIV
jgi:hypothetical protein